MLTLSTEMPYAAGLMYRQQQMKAMKQRQAQEEYQREYQQQGQSQNPHGPQQPTYQQTVDERNQAIAQAIRSAHNQTMPSEGTGDIHLQNPVSSMDAAQPVTAHGNSMDVKDTVDLSEVWKKLDTRSSVWSLLIDDQSKVLTVSEYISRFQNEGVKITAPPMHYVQMIDQMVVQNPGMLQRPFGELLQVMAIIDYDFDNGMDKDALAKKVLGQAGFEENKKRFTQQASGGNQRQ